MLICYIVEACTDLTIPFWAEFLTANLVHIQGILNVTLYGLNSDLRNVISEKLKGSFHSSNRSHCEMSVTVQGPHYSSNQLPNDM